MSLRKVKLAAKRTLLFVVVWTVAASAMPIPVVGATSSWLDPLHDPTVTLSDGHVTPQDVGLLDPCVLDTKFITRPYKVTTTYPYYQTEQTQLTCAGRMYYGLIGVGPAATTLLQLNGTGVAGTVKTALNASAILNMASSPDAKNAIRTYSSGGYPYAEVFPNFMENLSAVSVDSQGKVAYKLSASPVAIKDASNNVIRISSDSPKKPRFSNNGLWMIAHSPLPGGSVMVRVNLTTGAVLPFAPGSSSLQGAISNDGRYAIWRGTGIGPRIYDLDTCGTVPNTITTYVSCDYKDLATFMGTALPGSQGLSTFDFITNDVISLRVKYLDANNVAYYKKARLIAYGATATSMEYMALGDSFASGEGAYNYYGETDSDDNRCHLSQVSYPYLIGQTLDLESYASAACSGAKMDHVTSLAQELDIPDPNTLGDLLPGYRRQLDYLRQYEPGVVTIAMVGNDIEFSKKIGSCIRISTCFDTYEERKLVVKDVNNKFNDLVDMYNQIKAASAAGVKIYVIGYPSLVSDYEYASCGNNVRLNTDERKFANLLADYLNTVIEAAANKAGVRYVDVTDAMNGHRLCETVYSNMAFHGLTKGSNAPLPVLGPFALESYHPTKLGHKMLETKILSETSNFTQEMPTPDPNAAPPDPNGSLDMYDGFVPTSTVLPNSSAADEMASELLVREQDESVAISSVSYPLKKSSAFNISIHSDPTDLGTFYSDANGDLDAEVNIPDTVEPGYHTLHITGKSMTDEDVDLYKVVYVAQSEDDWDGDEIDNDEDSCPAIPDTNADADEDGIDDDCDGYINDAPDDIADLYRARQGNSQESEDPNTIYIERNVELAESMLGIEDVDANSDGWVTVGQTDEDTDGVIANFWTEDKGPELSMTDKYIPHVSIRHPENGCLQFTPANRAVVEDASAREVDIEATNTDTCRSEPPDADTDNNSLPDNEQPLYRARNGNAMQSEDPDKIYIERNVAASEAILGITDYDANSDGWAIIAVSDTPYNGTYDNLVLVNPNDSTVLSTDGTFTSTMLELPTEDQRQILPLALVTQPDPTCIAIKPSSLEYVAVGQNRTITTSAVPEGVGCGG